MGYLIQAGPYNRTTGRTTRTTVEKVKRHQSNHMFIHCCEKVNSFFLERNHI